ncbi:MAG: gamma-glutamyltransferase, partial [Nocardioidaceae bacterium]
MSPMTHRNALRPTAVAAVAGLVATTLPLVAQGASAGDHRGRQPVARGSGGAVSSVDPSASRIGLRVLRAGGNAVDAAVATAAALGVTEPYSAGIGGGGYFVYFNARTHRVSTLDGRETAPAKMPHDAFIDPSTGEPYPFFPDLVTSGVSVGVPGTLATWQGALHRWGSTSLKQALRPAAKLARHGFRVDKTFHRQTKENAERFAAFPATSRLYLPNGHPRRIGSLLRNLDLAATYDLIGRRGKDALYRGALARQISSVVRSPRARSDTDLPIPPGFMKPRDLANYRVIARRPTHVRYQDLDVYGMPPSSSGGTTVGEVLNILDDFRLSPRNVARSLHLYLEA